MHQFENFFDLLDEDDFFGGASDRPELQQALDQGNVKHLGLLEVVLRTQLQLSVVGSQRLHLVQWNEHSFEEIQVFWLQGHCQT